MTFPYAYNGSTSFSSHNASNNKFHVSFTDPITTRAIITLAISAFFCIASIVLASIAFDKSLHIPLNYIIAPNASPSFQTESNSKLQTDATDFYPLAPVTLTYNPNFTATPFVFLQATNNLNGLPCATLISDPTPTSAVTQIFACPKNGFIVNNLANTVINPSMASFALTDTFVPAMAYVLNQVLYYQVAQDINGILWSAPVQIASVPLNATSFKLLNVGERPTLAWLDNTNKFYFAQGNTYAWSSYALSPITVTPGYNLQTTILDLDYIDGQPAIVVRNSTSNDLIFFRSTDGGTTWTTSTTIVSATAMSAVSLTTIHTYPAVATVTTGNSLQFYRALDTTGSTGPWTATTILGSGISGANLKLGAIIAPNTNEFRPIVWALTSATTRQFFYIADNINGTSWTSTNQYSVNSANTQDKSSNGHMLVNNSITLLISYIDQSDRLQYMNVTNSNFSAALNGANATQVDPSARHPDTSSTMAIVGNGGIAFSYVRDGKLLFFRPVVGDVILDPSYLLTYTATGRI
jgi:hypothetical protein